MFMMWFDNSKRSLPQKLREGAAAYQERFQAPAKVVLVNPTDFDMLHAQTLGDLDLQVVSRATVQLHNFWFGMEVPA